MKDLYLAERYELVNKIGSGGGGEVYAVYDKNLQKKLALKIFSPDESASPDDNAFFNEFFLVLKLASSNLVKVYDYGYNENNFPFYTMELLDEGNIDDDIAPDDTNMFLHTCHKIASSLSFLHFFNLIHNDLKPENVKLIKSQGETIVKLLDLGLTIDFNPDNPDKRLAGTVEYMAPELFDSKQPDKKSDLYSLGVIIYKLITGKVPYTGDDPLMIISDKLEKPFAPIENNGNYPDEFIELTHRMLSKDADSRPDSVFKTAQAIGKLIDEDSFKINPSELVESLIGIKLAKMFERNRYEDNEAGIFVFEDEVVLNKFSELLKAILQSQYYNVFECADSNSDPRFSEVSSKAVKRAVIKKHRLSPGENYEPEFGKEDLIEYRLLLKPEFGKCRIPEMAEKIEIDLTPDMEKWFDEERLDQELLDKLKAISSYDASALITSLNDLHDEKIISFAGDKWDIDSGRFISWPLPQELQKRAVDALRALPSGLFSVAAALSPMRYGFDRIFVLKYVGDSKGDPLVMLNELTEANILERKGDIYYFKNDMLRVGLVNSYDPESLRRLHLRAASIIEHNGIGVGQEERVLSLAHNFTCAQELDDSVKWTLRASEWLISNEKFRVALKMVSASLELAKKLKQRTDTSQYQARLLAALGNIENLLGHSNRSLKSFARIIRMKKKLPNQEIVARAYKYAGDVYKAACEYKKGLRALQKALEIYEKLDNRIELSHTYNNIGNIYWVGSKIDLALESYQKALEIQEELNLLKELASTLNNIGSCYIFKNRFDKTIDFYKRSIKIKKQINDRPELARTYNNLGAVYEELGDIPQALVYLYDSLKINREIDSKREILFNLENIGLCEIYLGHFQKALSFAEEGFALACEVESLPLQATFLRQIGIIQCETGQLGQADDILHQARRIVDNITEFNLEFLIYTDFEVLYLYLNDEEPFWISTDKALDRAREIDSDKQRLAVLLYRIEGLLQFKRDFDACSKMLNEAGELLKNVESDHLECRYYQDILKLAVETENVQPPDPEKLNILISKHVNQTLKPRVLYLQARLALGNGLYDRARDLLSEASGLAEVQNQRNLLWKIKFCQGKIERTLLNYEEAYVNFKKSVTILKSIAQTINRKDYLQNFLQHPMAMSLKSEIMDLARRMGQK